jgi:succinoglycan biosynthesis transport protein ExoP
MEIRQYLAIVWKWLWLIVLSTAIAAIPTFMTSRSAPPIYQTTTTIMVGQTIESPNPTSQDIWTAQSLAETYVQLVRRQTILEGAINALGLDMNWRALVGRVSVSLIEGTQLLEITVLDTDPQRAKVIADEIANQLILQSPTAPERAQREQRRAFVEEQIADLEAKIKAAQEQVTELEQGLTTAFSARQIQDTRAQIQALEAQINIWQGNYASLLAFTESGPINYLTIVEPAAVPNVPIRSRSHSNVLLAAAVGLILAVGAAFLLEYLDDTVKSPEDISKTLGLTTLGAITRIGGDTYPEKLITIKHPRSIIAEAYRILRTNIQFSAIDKPLKTILVSSPSPAEGKSVTIANLAVVMAQAGARVVIVDSDLRRPVMHRIFNLTNKEGLTNVLLQDRPLVDGYLQSTEVENLQVLTTGPLPPNPSELLGSQKMTDLIENLKEGADVVLLDSPPALPVTDAAVLSSKSDGVLIITDAGNTRRDTARRAKEDLMRVGANVLGVVLNKLSMRGGSYYYYYYYYYYYSRDGDSHRKWSSKRKKFWSGLLSRIPGLRHFVR